MPAVTPNAMEHAAAPPTSSAHAAGKAGTAHFAVKSPSIPIPFHRLFKVVAIVDAPSPETRELFDRLKAEKFEVEVTDRFDRDVSEDAAVGAYIALDRRRPSSASQGAGTSRPRRRLPHAAVGARRRSSDRGPRRLRAHRRGDRLHVSRSAEPGLLRQAGRGQHRRVRHEPPAAVLRRPDGLRCGGQHRVRLPRAPGRTVLSQVARRPTLLQAFRRRASSATTCATPTWISAICSFTKARPRRPSVTPRTCSAPTRPTSS